VPTQDAEAFAQALRELCSSPPDARACRENALRFSAEAFVERLIGWVGD
jgi:hypothetical protein